MKRIRGREGVELQRKTKDASEESLTRRRLKNKTEKLFMKRI